MASAAAATAAVAAAVAAAEATHTAAAARRQFPHGWSQNVGVYKKLCSWFDNNNSVPFISVRSESFFRVCLAIYRFRFRVGVGFRGRV